MATVADVKACGNSRDFGFGPGPTDRGTFGLGVQTESLTAAISAGDMSPLEATILVVSRDPSNILSLAGQLREQDRMLEFPAADMEAVKRACGSST